MNIKDNFEDDLLFFLHNARINNFFCFVNFEDLKNYYYTFFSFPILDKKELDVEELIKFQNSNNLTSKTVKDKNRTYSLYFFWSKEDHANDALYQFLVSCLVNYIYKIELEQCQIFFNFYDFSLHEIIKEENPVKKQDNFLQYILNSLANYFDAIQGYLNIKIMINNTNSEYSYSLNNSNEFNPAQIELKIYFENQFTSIITLFLKKEFSKNLSIPIEKRIILKKIESYLGFLIYSFLFLNEQKIYIESLEEILVQNKSELKIKNQQLLRQLYTISEIEQSRNLIFNKIYHQLLTPLNSILGFTMYIINFAGSNLSKDILNDIENIELNALFLLYNILDIIDYTKIITNSFSCNYEPFNFHQIYETTKKIIIFMQKYFDIKVEFNIKEADFNFVHDYKRIEQVIFTLLFFVLSSKNHGIYILNINLDENKKQLNITLTLESPLLDENYFSKLIYYKENINSKNFRNFTLEDFLAYCPIQIIDFCKDKIEFELTKKSFIIKIEIYEKKSNNGGY